MPTATKSVAIVSKVELLELAESEEKCKKAKAAADKAEKDVKLRRMQLAEKVIGIQTEDELKQLNPQQIEKKIARRAEAGDWQAGVGAPDFSFVQSRKGTYPAWAQLYESALGFAAAARVKAETDPTYSYRVEVAS